LTTRRDQQFILFLIALLLGAYMLVYIGAPESMDEKAILATSASMVQFGRFDMNAAESSDWLLLPLSRLGTFGADGALYAKKGITPALVMSPVIAIGRLLPWLSIRATGLLFNALVTAFTAVLIYRFGRRLGYKPGTTLATGLIYGLCTLAFVYTKTAFGEPVVGLLLSGALFAAYDAGVRIPEYGVAHEKSTNISGFNRTIQRLIPIIALIRTNRISGESGTPSTYLSLPIPGLLICGTLLILCVGANTVYIVFIPIIALYLLPALKLNIRAWLSFIAPIFIGGLLLLIFNYIRFGSFFSTGYNFALGEGFTHPFWRGVYGLTIGAQRGIFWYSPILLLCIPGWLMFRKRASSLAWTGLLLIVSQILVFAAWWSWHGGIVWGPRFLLPALPIAVLFLLPLIESRKTPILAAVFGLSTLSFGIQLLGALYSYFPYVGYLFGIYTPFGLDGVMADSFFFDPLASPIVGHLAMMLSGWPLQPLWIRNGFDIGIFGSAIALIAGGLFVLRLRSRRSIILVGILALIALNMPPLRQTINNLPTEAVRLENTLNPPGFVVAATTLFDDALVDYHLRSVTMNAPTAPDDERARAIWRYALQQNRLLWFVTWFNPANVENWQERELWERGWYVNDRTLAGKHRALLFDLSTPQLTDHKGEWHFANGVILQNCALAVTSDGVYVSLEWKPDTPRPTRDYSWFVHLVDMNGNILAQQDRAPQGGYQPTSKWTGKVADRLFFPVKNIGSGWRVRVGYVDPDTGKPISITDQSGATLPDPFLLFRQ